MRRAAARNASTRVFILDSKADDLAGIFISAQQSILDNLLGVASGPRITPSRAAAISSDIDRIIQTELTVPGTLWVEQNTPELYNLGITQGARTFTAQSGADVFDAVPNERVRQTFLNFSSTPNYEAVVSEGFAGWLGEIRRTDADMLRSIRNTLTEGSILGLDNRTIVGNLLEGGEIRPIIFPDGRQISAETRARAIVRTEGLRAINQAEIAVNQASGLNAYVDVGVKDNVTSGICRVAQRQVPHTTGWWHSSPLGIPPRHVANCRDELLAVELATFTVAGARALGIRGYNPATFELDSGKITPGEARRLQREIAVAEDRVSKGQKVTA